MIRTRDVFTISVLFFVALLFVLPSTFISSGLGNTILTMGTFLFGIIAGFYIIVTTTDYNSMKSFLAKEAAGLISLYKAVETYDQQSAKELARLVDEYIRRSFDYEIIDSTRGTAQEFSRIRNFVFSLPIKSELSSLHQVIVQTTAQVEEVIQQVTVLGSRTLSRFQWTVLVVLGGLVVASLYGLRTGELFFDIVTVLISSSVVLIFFLIRELDLYIWNEKTFSFEIYQNVFKAIGQLPFYPLESIKKGRIHPTENEYRLGIYINFPKSLERKIEIRRKDWRTASTERLQN